MSLTTLENSGRRPGTEVVPLFASLLREWANAPLPDPSNPAELPQPETVTLEHLFGELYATDPEACEKILKRTEWMAEQLKDRAAGTALVDAAKELSVADAYIGFQWIIQCIPQVKDASGEAWQYQSFDTKRYSLSEQNANILTRFIPHSWLAGMVAYSLAEKINTAQGRHVVSENKLLWELFIHEAGRAVTHNRKVHDNLLPYICQKAGILPQYWPVEGPIHPRVLVSEEDEGAELNVTQLEQIIAWVADMYCKADDENAPYANGEPHLRSVSSGLQHLMFSMLGYREVPDDAAERQEIWNSLVEKNAVSIYYLLEQQLIEVVPHWFDELGVSVQETLSEWEPSWRALLHSLITTRQLPEWLQSVVPALPVEVAQSSEAWVHLVQELPNAKKMGRG